MAPELDGLHRELHDRTHLQPVPVALSLWVDDVLGSVAHSWPDTPRAEAIAIVSGLNGSVRLARERPMEHDMTTVRYELDFSEISLSDVPQVGGKNASLGELYRALQSKGVGALSSCSV